MSNQAQPQIVATIDGVGSVNVKQDLAHFSLTVRAKSEKLESAKSQVAEKTQQVLKTLEQFKNAGTSFDTEVNTSISNFKLEHREAGEKYPAGFQTVNAINWTTVVDDNLNEMYKTCLKFDSHMYAPWYSVKNKDAYFEQAVDSAAEDVKKKLQRECSLLNISVDSLKILNWNFNYSGYLPSLNAYGPAGVQGSLGVSGATGPTGPQGSTGYSNSSYNFADDVRPVKIGTTYQELIDPPTISAGSENIRVAVRVNYIWA